MKRIAVLTGGAESDPAPLRKRECGGRHEFARCRQTHLDESTMTYEEILVERQKVGTLSVRGASLPRPASGCR
jgi:hypothetical protein